MANNRNYKTDREVLLTQGNAWILPNVATPKDLGGVFGVVRIQWAELSESF